MNLDSTLIGGHLPTDQPLMRSTSFASCKKATILSSLQETQSRKSFLVFQSSDKRLIQTVRNPDAICYPKPLAQKDLR